MVDKNVKFTLTADNRTGQAFSKVKSELQGLDGAAESVGARFGSLGVLVAGAFAGVSAAAVVDLLDSIDDLAEKSGITVEQLSALRYAGGAVGTSFEDLQVGTRKLAINMAEAAGGSKEAAAAFKSLGVDVKDSAGNLRTTDAVLLDLADRFASYGDGPGKAAKANEIFGKSGEKLIPLLDQGRSGINALRKEAEALGVVYSGELAAAGAKLNDNLAKLKFAAEGAAASLAGPFIKSLADATTFLVEATIKTGRLQGLLISLGAGFAKLLNTDEIGQLQTQAEAISGEIERITNVLVGLSNVLEKDPGNERAQRRYANLSAKLKDLQGQAAKTSEALKIAADVQQFGPNPVPITDGIKPQAPVTSKGVAAAISEYEKLIARIKERGAVEQAELDQGQKLTDAQKFAIDIVLKLADANNKLTDDQKRTAGGLLEQVLLTAKQNDENERLLKSRRETDQLLEKYLNELLRTNDAQREQNKQLQDFIQEIGLTADEIQKLRLARQADAAAAAEQAYQDALMAGSIGAEAEALRERAKLLREESDLRRKAYDLQRQQATDPKLGAKRAVDDYLTQAQEVGVATEQLTKNTIQGLEDGITGLLMGQKDAFRQLIDATIAEITRLAVVRPLLASIFGNSGGGGNILTDLVTSFLGSAVGITTGDSGLSATGDLIRGRRAAGGPVAANSIYQVLERGRPEMFSSGGRDYLMTGAQGGMVVADPRTGTQQVNHISITVPPGTDRNSASQMAAAIAQRLAIANARNN